MQEWHLCFSMIPDKFPVKCDENTEHRNTISYISMGSKYAGHHFLKTYLIPNCENHKALKPLYKLFY